MSGLNLSVIILYLKTKLKMHWKKKITCFLEFNPGLFTNIGMEEIDVSTV